MPRTAHLVLGCLVTSVTFLSAACGGSTSDEVAATGVSTGGSGGVAAGGSNQSAGGKASGGHSAGGQSTGGQSAAGHAGTTAHAGSGGSATHGGNGGATAGGNGGSVGGMPAAGNNGVGGGEAPGAGGATAGAGGESGGAGQGGSAGTGGVATGGMATGGAAGSTSNGGGAGVSDPGVISKAAFSGLETEPHVAAGPGGRVVAAWIAVSLSTGGSDLGYAFSEDYGTTWSAPQALKAAGGRVGSDPVLTFDTAGNAYVTEIAFDRDAQGNVSNMQVLAATAPAGSQTFGAPVVIAGDGSEYDKPWLRLTKSGALVLTFAKTSSGGIYAATSVDGVTWSTSVIVEDGAFRNLVYPCLAEDTGRIYVAYNSGGGIGLRWSDDEGKSWPAANKVAAAKMGDNPAFEDPTCAARGNNVWVAYGLTHDVPPNGDVTQINAKLYSVPIAHSGDGGKTIDSWVEGIDTAQAPLALIPQLGIEESGRLDLLYYAGKAEGDASATLRYRQSSDGGMTWGSSVLVHSPIEFVSFRTKVNWMGDYMGLDLRDGSLYAAYGVSKSTPLMPGPTHVAFYRTVLLP